jgi:hypothetical protein
MVSIVCIVVLYPEATKDLHSPTVHPDGDAEVIFPNGIAQCFAGGFIQAEHICNSVELLLRYYKWIVGRYMCFDGFLNHYRCCFSRSHFSMPFEK